MTYFVTSLTYWRYASNSVNDVPFGIISPWIPFLNHVLDGDLCETFCDFHIFLFSGFSHDFIIYIDFMIRIATSNIATNDVTNCHASEMTYIVSSGALNSTHSLSHKVFNTNI